MEAGPSQRGRPSGAAGGGRDFEQQLGEFWSRLLRLLHTQCGMRPVAVESGKHILSGLVAADGTRRILVNLQPEDAFGRFVAPTDDVPPLWGQRRFLVSELVEWHLGGEEMRFAPLTEEDSPHYWGTGYPKMYAGRTTQFDFNAVCEKSGQLIEKMLFEYKAAKSSNRETVDGNVHERLGYQMLQYLEIAQRHGNTSLNVIGSSAFAKYKNKYHVTFNQQALRLADTYSTFRMRFAACASDYYNLFAIIPRFLIDGKNPPRDYRRQEG